MRGRVKDGGTVNVLLVLKDNKVSFLPTESDF